MRCTFSLAAMLLISTPCPAAEPDLEGLRKALTFHASFDGQADADFARGDKKVYTAPAFANRKDAKAGLHRADVEIAKGKGKFGDALRFGKNDKAVILFQGAKNMPYRDKDWSGSVSFWLSLDPDKDLAPGYCDPIQITDKKWDDSAFFVDFTKDDNPRHFRLGAYADFKLWNPKNRKFDDIPKAELPLSQEILKPPFARERWTHVAFTFKSFNTGKPDGVATLYMDGKPAGTIKDRVQTFTWDQERSVIMLGLSYIGLFDDLAIFDRALSDEEVGTIFKLDGGIKGLGK